MIRKISLTLLWASLLASTLAGDEAKKREASLGDFGRTWKRAASQVTPAVVQIEVDRTAEEPDKEERQGKGQIPEMFQRLFRRTKHPDHYKIRPSGGTSGVLISSDGLVLTSWFNVSGTLRSITVKLSNGRSFRGKLLGHDEARDLALVKIEGEKLPHAPLAETNHLRVGHFVAVLGRGADLTHHTMTTGIVSAMDRNDGNHFQHSARTNYENTGGAIIDIEGRLLGVVALVREVAGPTPT